MNLLAPISDIMTTELITVSPEDTIESIKDIFEEKGIHHLPVTVGGKLKGMVSKSDFLLFSKSFDADVYDEFLEGIRRKNYKVKDLMTTKLAKLEPNDRVNVALEVFRVNKFHALPVVEGEDLKGIVTTFDIIDYLARDSKADMSYK
jgi:acetoin utilization protein AcuB